MFYHNLVLNISKTNVLEPTIILLYIDNRNRKHKLLTCTTIKEIKC